MVMKDVAISPRELVVQQDVGMEEGKGLMMLLPNLSMRTLLKSGLKTK